MSSGFIPFPPVLLLAEDDADDQRLFQWAIRKSGLAVVVRLAADGEQAIEYLSHRLLPGSNPLDRVFLILSDVNMPRKSGWDLLEWVRRRRQFEGLPVLMWTSLPNPEGELRAHRLGATSYFSKPLHAEGYKKLVSRIGDYLRD